MQGQQSLIPESRGEALPKLDEYGAYQEVIRKYGAGEPVGNIIQFVAARLGYGARKAKKFTEEAIVEHMQERNHEKGGAV